MEHKLINNGQYLLVVSDENYKSNVFPYLVAERLTTNEFQLWQVDNENDWDDKNQYRILAHLPLKDSPILQGVDLLPPLEQEDDVEKLSNEWALINADVTMATNSALNKGFKGGYNKAKEKWKYTEEDMRLFGIKLTSEGVSFVNGVVRVDMDKFEELLKSISQPKLPVAFKRICDCAECMANKQGLSLGICKRRFTTTNSQGQTVWVGEYIY